MKRPLILPLILILIATACSFTSQTPAAPPPTTPGDSVSPTIAPTESAPATAQPAGNAPTLLYISGTTHIESKPEVWPNVDAFLAFLQQVTALGMKWSVGADIGWLEGEPRAAELIQASEALGVQWDVHAHSPQDRAKAAYLITQMGGHPSSVVSGMLVSEFSNIGPQTYQGFTWTPQVLWGGTNCPGHRPGCDDYSAGLWIPLSAEQYATHDSSGQYIRVGDATLSGDQILVATGTRPVIPTIDGLDDVPYLTSDLLTMGEAMELTELPESMIIVGAGYIALELGQMFHRFGTKATILERSQVILPRYEPEVSDALTFILRKEGVNIITEAQPIDFGDAYFSHPVNDLRRFRAPADRRAVMEGYLEDGTVSEDFMAVWRIGCGIADMAACVYSPELQPAALEELDNLLRETTPGI